MKQEDQVCKNCSHYYNSTCNAAKRPIIVDDPFKDNCKMYKSRQYTRGGARPGAGRKAIDPEEKRVQMVVTIDRETREKLQAISKARNMNPGRIIDEMVKGEW